MPEFANPQPSYQELRSTGRTLAFQANQIRISKNTIAEIDAKIEYDKQKAAQKGREYDATKANNLLQRRAVLVQGLAEREEAYRQTAALAGQNYASAVQAAPKHLRDDIDPTTGEPKFVIYGTTSDGKTYPTTNLQFVFDKQMQINQRNEQTASVSQPTRNTFANTSPNFTRVTGENVYVPPPPTKKAIASFSQPNFITTKGESIYVPAGTNPNAFKTQTPQVSNGLSGSFNNRLSRNSVLFSQSGLLQTPQKAPSYEELEAEATGINQRAQAYFSSPELQRVQGFAGFLTLGGGRLHAFGSERGIKIPFTPDTPTPVEKRGFIGQTSQLVTYNLLASPQLSAGGLINTYEKFRFQQRIATFAPNPNAQKELKANFGTLAQTYNPLTSQGASNIIVTSIGVASGATSLARAGSTVRPTFQGSYTENLNLPPGERAGIISGNVNLGSKNAGVLQKYYTVETPEGYTGSATTLIKLEGKYQPPIITQIEGKSLPNQFGLLKNFGAETAKLTQQIGNLKRTSQTVLSGTEESFYGGSATTVFKRDLGQFAGATNNGKILVEFSPDFRNAPPVPAFRPGLLTNRRGQIIPKITSEAFDSGGTGITNFNPFTPAELPPASPAASGFLQQQAVLGARIGASALSPPRSSGGIVLASFRQPVTIFAPEDFGTQRKSLYQSFPGPILPSDARPTLSPLAIPLSGPVSASGSGGKSGSGSHGGTFPDTFPSPVTPDEVIPIPNIPALTLPTVDSDNPSFGGTRNLPFPPFVETPFPRLTGVMFPRVPNFGTGSNNVFTSPRMGRGFRYVPSLTAGISGIRSGRKTLGNARFLTGFEVRPIQGRVNLNFPTKSRKKKVKRR